MFCRYESYFRSRTDPPTETFPSQCAQYMACMPELKLVEAKLSPHGFK